MASAENARAAHTAWPPRICAASRTVCSSRRAENNPELAITSSFGRASEGACPTPSIDRGACAPSTSAVRRWWLPRDEGVADAELRQRFHRDLAIELALHGIERSTASAAARLLDGDDRGLRRVARAR